MTQQLFLVIGGELESLEGTTFRNPDAVHVVGVFPKAEALRRWRDAACISIAMNSSSAF